MRALKNCLKKNHGVKKKQPITTEKEEANRIESYNETRFVEINQIDQPGAEHPGKDTCESEGRQSSKGPQPIDLAKYAKLSRVARVLKTLDRTPETARRARTLKRVRAFLWLSGFIVVTDNEGVHHIVDGCEPLR